MRLFHLPLYNVEIPTSFNGIVDMLPRNGTCWQLQIRDGANKKTKGKKNVIGYPKDKEI